MASTRSMAPKLPASAEYGAGTFMYETLEKQTE
jgi:hypothetical protein